MAIRVRKELVQKWYDVPYLVTDDSIDAVLNQWLVEWHYAADFVVGGSKSVA